MKTLKHVSPHYSFKTFCISKATCRGVYLVHIKVFAPFDLHFVVLLCIKYKVVQVPINDCTSCELPSVLLCLLCLLATLTFVGPPSL